MTRLAAFPAQYEPSRVCIIKPSSMGDIVHALPILSSLRNRWPHAHLSWVVNAPFREILEGHADLDELIVYRRGGDGVPGGGIAGTCGLLWRLSRGRYDLTIDLQGLFRSALMAAATLAKIRVGMADAREGARWFYTHHVDAPRLGIHAVARALRVASALGAPDDEPRFRLPVRAQDRQWARETLAAVRRPRIVLNVGARWPTKRWPPRYFAELGRRAAEDLGAGLIAVGSDLDRPLVDELKRHLSRLPILDLCGRTGLRQLAALAGEADLLISSDTGPLHLAAAAGARVVGIFTCTDPKLTGPVGPAVATVQTQVWCAASFLKRCRRLECMSELLPDRVWPVVASQLELKRSPVVPAAGSA
jgi:lipopolysaccharide heptosyltransferase I